jgi:hypothetical protein
MAELRDCLWLTPHCHSGPTRTETKAELTSKDPELNAAERHDRAIAMLSEKFDLNSPALDGNGEVLGTAAGIYKRRWQDLGRFDDLKTSADLYARGALGSLGQDAHVAPQDTCLSNYRRTPVTSIDATCTVFLIGTGAGERVGRSALPSETIRRLRRSRTSTPTPARMRKLLATHAFPGRVAFPFDPAQSVQTDILCPEDVSN